jgi:hypothetical protein
MEQRNLFLEKVNDSLLEEQAIALLIEKGYLVKKLPQLMDSNLKVDSPSKLVIFFCDTLERHRTNFNLACSTASKKEAGFAKKFFESRKATGISKAKAYEECCYLIQAAFKFEKELGLNSPITSMAIFGTDTMGWVTEKLLTIVNGENRQLKAKEDEAWFNNYYSRIEETSLTDKEFSETTAKLDRILKNG